MLDNQTIVRAPDGRLISIGRTGVKVETPVKASTGISRSPEINASKPRSSPAQVGAKIEYLLQIILTTLYRKILNLQWYF